MTRALSPFAGALAVAAVAVSGAMDAHAASREEATATCAAKFKDEFGEAEVNFDTFRRNDGRQLLIGEMVLSTGETTKVRCDVRKGRVLDVRFRTGNESSQDGELWTTERPEGAEFVGPKKPEGAEGGSGTATTTDGTAKPAEGQTAEGGEGQQGASGSTETAAAPSGDGAAAPAASGGDAAQTAEGGTQTGEQQPQATGQQQTGDQQPATGQQQAEGQQPAEGQQQADAAGATKDGDKKEGAEAEPEEDLTRPKFIKVPGS